MDVHGITRTRYRFSLPRANLLGQMLVWCSPFEMNVNTHTILQRFKGKPLPSSALACYLDEALCVSELREAWKPTLRQVCLRAFQVAHWLSPTIGSISIVAVSAFFLNSKYSKPCHSDRLVHPLNPSTAPQILKPPNLFPGERVNVWVVNTKSTSSQIGSLVFCIVCEAGRSSTYLRIVLNGF